VTWNNTFRKIQQRIDKVVSTYDIPRYIVWIIWVLPFIIISLQLLLSFEFLVPLRKFFWGENHFMELAQFGSMFIGGLIALNLAWKTFKQMESPIIWLFFGLFSMGLLFTAMEEIAWGQQILEFRTPGFMKDLNVQHEVTIHNLAGFQEKSIFLNLVFSVGGFIGVFVYLVPIFKKLRVPKVLTIWFVLMIPLSFVSLFTGQFRNDQIVFIVDQQSGTVELLIGLAGMIYVWLKSKVLIFSRIRMVPIRAIEIQPERISINLKDDRTLSFPYNYFPWMENFTQEQLSDYQLTEKKNIIRWSQIGKSISMSQVFDPKSKTNYPGIPTKLMSPYFLTIIIAGLLSVGWLLLLPGDPKNAWMFGLSKTRLAMVGMSIGLLVPPLILGVMVRRKRVNRNQMFWDNQTIHTNLNVILGGSFFIFFFSSLLLVVSFFFTDPFWVGVITRLKPWILWNTIIWGCATLWANQELIRKRRWQMSPATHLVFTDQGLLFRLSDQREITVALSWLPWINPKNPTYQDLPKLIKSGRRVKWEKNNQDLCIDQFLCGIPPH
jgi:Ca2+/Na+ antiporter